MKVFEAIDEIKSWTGILMSSGRCSLEMAEAQKMAIEALEKQQQTLDLKAIFTELEKKSFSVDFGQTESMAVRLVDVEDMLINQFK